MNRLSSSDSQGDWHQTLERTNPRVLGTLTYARNVVDEAGARSFQLGDSGGAKVIQSFDNQASRPDCLARPGHQRKDARHLVRPLFSFLSFRAPRPCSQFGAGFFTDG